MADDAPTVLAMLTRIPLFAPLPSSELQALAGRMHSRKFKKGEAIIRLDDLGKSFFLIRSGQVKVIRPLESGEEAVMNLLGEGDFFGELALLDGRPRSASVYALETTEVLVLPREDFLAFLASSPSAAVEMIVVLADRIRTLNAQVEEAFYMDLPQRLARRLTELGRRWGKQTNEGLEIHIPITQGDLAGMVGASRQRVNRLLGEWQDRRLIRLGGRGEVVILAPETLEQFCL